MLRHKDKTPNRNGDNYATAQFTFTGQVVTGGRKQVKFLAAALNYFMKNYKQIIDNGRIYRIYASTIDAWNALTPKMFAQGWRIGCYGGFENCIWM